MSNTLLILKIYTTLKDVQVILKHFFDIPTGFRYKKMEKSSPSIYRDVYVSRQITSFKVMYQCFTNTNKIFQKKPLLMIFTKVFAFLDISKITITAQKVFKNHATFIFTEEMYFFLQNLSRDLPAHRLCQPQLKLRVETWLLSCAEQLLKNEKRK